MVFGIGSFSGIFNSILVDQSILISVAFVVIIAAAIAFIARILKQDLIPAYIVAGIIIGPLCFGLIKDPTLIKGFAEIGVTFLLFVAGLELSIKKFKESFGTAALTGIIQVISIAAISFFVFIAFKFARVEAVILGLAIAISSTVVVTKILADRGELNTLHARLTIGILLVQDIIVIVALALLTQNLTVMFVILTLLKLVALGFIAWFAHFAFFRHAAKHAASLPELLFIITIAFLFVFVALAFVLEIPIAIGAFIAGITLANSPYKVEIIAKTKALRDFFSVMFFVAIGMWLTHITKDLLFLLIPIFVLLIVVEPVITAILLRLSGYKTRTSLQTGFSFAQISEFALILVVVALGIGLISQRAFDIIILTAVISMAATPYTMRLSKPFSKVFESLFSFRKAYREKEQPITRKKTVLIFGSHRMGTIFLKQLEKIRHKILVIDFDPEIIKALTKRKIDCIYGDASNPELLNRLERIYLPDARVIISTLPKMEENLLMLKHFKKAKPRVFVALTAEKVHDALHLYKQGADYVIVPMVISAEQSIDMIKKLNKKQFTKLKKEHIAYLEDIHKFLY